MAVPQLNPLALPDNLPNFLPGALSSTALALTFFYFAIAYWVAYTIVAVYHWITYSHHPAVATPAIALHLFISLVLIGYAVTGLF